MSSDVICLSESEEEEEEATVTTESEDETPSKRFKFLDSDADEASGSECFITSVEFHGDRQWMRTKHEDVLPEKVKTMDISKSPVKVKPELQLASNSEEVIKLHDLEQLPVYAQPSKLLTTQEAVRVLLSSELSKSSICSRVPFAVEMNAVLIVDLNQLSSPKDLLCDDMGVWSWGGSRKRWMSVEEDGLVTFIGGKLDSDESCYHVWKRYYSLKASSDVKKMIIVLEDVDGDTLNLALVQYLFSQGEHKLKIAPHGNSRYGQPYVRTMPSVMSKLKKEALEKTPKRALQFVSCEAGGIMEARSAGALPRSRQQVKDARRKVTNKQDFDPLYAVMHMCKEGEGTRGDAFVRMVNAAPFPMMLIAFDYSLDDLVRFCTPPQNFSILGVDPTFNLGDFDVTVTTYRHLLLQPEGSPTGKPPVMLGPMFIHVRKDFAAYHFFTSSLVGQRVQLSSLQAFGTDGELALENALAATFPKAEHLRCFLHFRGNIERKLQSLNIPHPVANEIVKDILGNPLQLQHGLVDSKSIKSMDEMLERFESRWNEFEKPYNSPPSFHSWFMIHSRDIVAKCMLQDVRVKAGLGCPPSPYYTNEVESKNRVLKEEVQYKSSQLPDFVDKMRGLMEEQRREIERAVISAGEYRLREEYRKLAVEPSKWFKMTTDQRRRKVDRFMNAAVQDSSDQTSSSNCPLDELAIPQQLKMSLWKKAEELVNDDNAIVRAPGDTNECAWMVRSYSSKRPHYVKMSKAGGFICDEQCLSYTSMRMCSHTVALAIKRGCMDKFLRWYRTMKYKPNFTTLAEVGKPSTAGKKSARKGVSKKGAEQIRKVVANAEQSDLEWKSRGDEPPLSLESELQGTSNDTVAADVGSSGLYDPNSNRSPPIFQASSTQTHSTSANPALRVSPTSVNCPATALVSSQRDVHNIHFVDVGGVHTTVSSPPPLIPAHSVYLSPTPTFVIAPPSQTVTVGQHGQQQQRPGVSTPFWLVFIFGNISRCNGCKGKICRDVNGRLLSPPDDIVLGHKEYVVFPNPRSGRYEQTREKKNVYYHPWKTCIAPNFLDFDAVHHITVTPSVRQKLLPPHFESLRKEFGIFL